MLLVFMIFVKKKNEKFSDHIQEEWQRRYATEESTSSKWYNWFVSLRISFEIMGNQNRFMVLRFSR